MVKTLWNTTGLILFLCFGAPMAYAENSYAPHTKHDYPTTVYFGDTHLHSNMSFDITLDPYNPLSKGLSREDAYHFAQGKPVIAHNGQTFKLDRPLDFLVIADHGAGIGVMQGIENASALLLQDKEGQRLHKHYVSALQSGGRDAAMKFHNDFGKTLYNQRVGGIKYLQSVWDDITSSADRHNIPGKFTAFTAYEYSAAFNNHRVVIYKNDQTYTRTVTPFTKYDSNDPEALWAYMANYEQNSGGGVLAIPHNGNLSSGHMFMVKNLQGQSFSRSYAQTRQRWEPLYEINQIKGDSETHPALSPTDAFADYMYWPNYTGTKAEHKQWRPYEYARSGLKLGLGQQATLGVNPFKFGFVGGTDMHTSLSGAAENNFIGNRPVSEPNAERATGIDPFYKRPTWQLNAGGYAAVWATENTREALFAAMKRKEVYATTGPRMTVRFFGGWDYGKTDAARPDLARIGYSGGVPMGGDLTNAPQGKSPKFLIRAVKDPDGANLDRVQVIKGWHSADGKLHEKVYNVALSDDRKDKGNRTRKVGSTVDVKDASYTNNIGDPELAVVWRDPDFKADELAFYYVRVLEIPTPRWTAYDAKFFKLKDVPKEIPMVTQERAYSSPIWYTP